VLTEEWVAHMHERQSEEGSFGLSNRSSTRKCCDKRSQKKDVGNASRLGMATSTYLSGSTISYTYPLKKFLPVGLPIYARGYKILPIPIPARVISPVGHQSLKILNKHTKQV
jgi:hypothetical protein